MRSSHIYPNPRGEFEELRKSSDCSKAKAMIGWEPQISLSEGIRGVSGEEVRGESPTTLLGSGIRRNDDAYQSGTVLSPFI